MRALTNVSRSDEQHSGIQLDITITDEEFDIVAEGYDAGVRLAEVIEQDMVAVPVSSTGESSMWQ